MIRGAPAIPREATHAAGAAAPSAAASVFRVRPMDDGDVAFVTDSWLRSAWHAEDRKLKERGTKKRQRIQAGRSWYDAVRPHVEGLVGSGGVLIVVACDREDPSHIAAWVAWRDDQPLKLYVKHAYRGWGVDDLLREAMETL